MLTAFRLIAGAAGVRRRWECICDCGKTRILQSGVLLSGVVRSCGCQPNSGQFVATHRMMGTAAYRTWASMRTRCTNPNADQWSLYGGRGIRICERWLHSFENFLADMGARPDGTTLDRIDSNGHYEPGNCRWATAIEQGRNRRNCKLEPHEHEQIRWLVVDCGYRKAHVAKFYKLSPSTVFEIVQRESSRITATA